MPESFSYIYYHLKFGRHVYKHKGTGVITDSLFKLGKVVKKPVVNFLKKTGKKVAEKGINKASDVVVKKAGDKIGNILRKRKQKSLGSKQRLRVVSTTRQLNQPKNNSLVRLNNLIASLGFLFYEKRNRKIEIVHIQNRISSISDVNSNRLNGVLIYRMPCKSPWFL